MRARPIIARAAALLLLGLPAAASAQAARPAALPPRLSDAELAQVTGRFLLPGGVEIALAVTSDTVVNGQVVLRTVLTVDQSSRLQVFGRDGAAGPASAAAAAAAATAGAGAAAIRATGVSVSVDRQSGIQTITPTFAATAGATVTVGAATAPDNTGLVALPLVPGAPGIATPDGVVSLAAVRGGAQVMLAGDRLGVTNIVGQSIATALVNSADNRVLGNVTNVAIDLKGAAPLIAASAAMRAQDVAIDAVTRGLMR